MMCRPTLAVIHVEPIFNIARECGNGDCKIRNVSAEEESSIRCAVSVAISSQIMFTRAALDNRVGAEGGGLSKS